MTFEREFEIADLFSEEMITILFEFEVTSWGSPSFWDDPGSGPEWEIGNIYVNGELIPYTWQRNRFYVSPEQQIAEGLWQALATACDEWIENYFDFDQNMPEPYDY